MSDAWADDHTSGGRTTVRDVLVDAERRLQRAGVPSPSSDASLIVGHALGVPRGRLFLLDVMQEDDKVRVEQLLARRLARVPLQHLLGTAAFRYLEVEVGPGVFIPRPETELVAEAAIRELGSTSSRPARAVDLCSGSGILALALATECPGAQVHAVEWDDTAIEWTRRNVSAHAADIERAGSSLTVHHADAGAAADPGGPLAALASTVDVVVSNPPYIPDQMVPRDPEVRDHEPHVALYGGPDGLDVVRRVARTAALLLRPGGLLVMEHADVQGESAGAAGVPGVLGSLMSDAGPATRAGVGDLLFGSVVDRLDLNGLPRFTLARRRAAS